MVGDEGCSAGSYLAAPTSPIPSHCAVIILFKSVSVHQSIYVHKVMLSSDIPRHYNHPKTTSDPTKQLTLKVLVVTIDAQWEGMGNVGSARYEPALLPPCPTIRVLSYSN